MSDTTFTSPTQLHFSFAAHLRLPSPQIEHFNVTGLADEVIDPPYPVSTNRPSGFTEQRNLRNHISKDLKQFSYSILSSRMLNNCLGRVLIVVGSVHWTPSFIPIAA
jgi:hypothetical protein